MSPLDHSGELKKSPMKYISLCLTLLLWVSLPASAQDAREEEREEWYLWTDDGVRHYVVEFGNARAPGDTVIVLHGGFGAEHSYLLDAVQPLTERYHFVLYDQRGSLRSPAPDSTISFRRLTRDLNLLRRELDLNEVTLLGHSMGTTVAYDYLAAHPNRVRGLVLTGAVLPLNTLEEIADFGADTTRYLAASRELQASAEARVTRELAEEGLDGNELSSKERTHKFLVRAAGRNLYHVERWRQIEGVLGYFRNDVHRALRTNVPKHVWTERDRRARRALRTFEGPIRIVIGDSDFTDPDATVWAHFAAQLPNAELSVLEEAGHNAWIDQPDRFRAALQEALDVATDQ